MTNLQARKQELEVQIAALQAELAQVTEAIATEAAAVEVAVEAAPAPKKKATPKKKAAGMNLTMWTSGITSAQGNATSETPKKEVERKLETAAEKKARRAANSEKYAAPKRTPKGRRMNESKWMSGIAANLGR